jgi:hypothetical protein
LGIDDGRRERCGRRIQDQQERYDEVRKSMMTHFFPFSKPLYYTLMQASDGNLWASMPAFRLKARLPAGVN